MFKYANSFGITGLHQMGSIEDYVDLVEHGDPTLRIWYGHWGPAEQGKDYDAKLRSILEVKGFHNAPGFRHRQGRQHGASAHRGLREADQ
jgi:hypothetical protein